MIAFEVSRNGVKLCTAGIGNFGVLTAIISWVAHDPESLTRLVDQGLLELSPTEMALDVGGLKSFLSGDSESLKWTGAKLSVGDEIVIRIVVDGADLTDQDGLAHSAKLVVDIRL